MTSKEHIEKNFCLKMDERDIILTNKKLFGNDNEHEYNFICYDGVAYGTANGWHERGKRNVIMSYPTIAQLCQYPAKMAAIREYAGLPSDERIAYGDIAVKYGKVGKWFIPADQLNVVEVLVKTSKICDWVQVTTEGNFRDIDSGKEISIRTAMHDIIEGLNEDVFNVLDNSAKFKFVQLLGSLL